MTEILKREFTVVASSILEGRSGPELATDQERDLANELHEHAEEDVASELKKHAGEDVANDLPREPCKNLIRDLVFDCWMFCGRIDAWEWRSEDIWRAFKQSRGNKPIYELSGKLNTVPIPRRRGRLAQIIGCANFVQCCIRPVRRDVSVADILSETFHTTPEQALEFKPSSWRAFRP